jgi:pimeloyl-ACP methyl ester carboxylesterase
MLSTLPLFCTLLLSGSPAVESTIRQVAPVAPVEVEGKWRRTPGHTQAVVLIHGFHYHFSNKSVSKAEFRPWQHADSAVVKTLAKHNDVFSFAYGQNVPIESIVKDSTLGAAVARLRDLGYRDVVLVGHSAGGLIARQFIEDFPESGVTKVVQVCAPNGGSPLAAIKGPKSQRVFLDCLTREGRKICLKERADKRIPDNVQFVCIVARMNTTTHTDGVVPCVNQWTADLQKQGIPAFGMVGTHREVVRDAKAAEVLAALVRDRQGRWTEERIVQARKELFLK